ncbi:MAG: LysM peptidoglycan-binding domain-containing protein [Firmicutes bacterium]|nr:LysM peptidoglycan-binding domain-containing protein [Bacillota bacterium]
MYKIYQVEYGDTINGIATKTGTTANNIKNINGLNTDADLVVGSLIIVPREANQLFETYTVKRGDSVYSIARTYNVDPSTLLLLNGLNKDDIIYPNQEITVPMRGVTVYVTRQGDTVDGIINNLGIDANTFNRENERIFVVEDQLVVHKKEGNN